MSSDRSARRCITSVDDRRCERGHPHTALGLGLRAGARVASLPTCVVTGGLSQLRTHTRRLERSCFTSRRSAHGPRSWLGGLIQPPAACYRPSQPKCGLNAALNVALYAGATGSHEAAVLGPVTDARVRVVGAGTGGQVGGQGTRPRAGCCHGVVTIVPFRNSEFYRPFRRVLYVRIYSYRERTQTTCNFLNS